jgi:hypothetical protein
VIVNLAERKWRWLEKTALGKERDRGILYSQGKGKAGGHQRKDPGINPSILVQADLEEKLLKLSYRSTSILR